MIEQTTVNKDCIYAVVHTKTEHIAYNGKSKYLAIEAAKYAESNKIPYIIVKGEL